MKPPRLTDRLSAAKEIAKLNGWRPGPAFDAAVLSITGERDAVWRASPWSDDARLFDHCLYFYDAAGRPIALVSEPYAPEPGDPFDLLDARLAAATLGLELHTPRYLHKHCPGKTWFFVFTGRGTAVRFLPG